MTTEPLRMKTSVLYAEEDRDKKKEQGSDGHKQDDKDRNKDRNE